MMRSILWLRVGNYGWNPGAGGFYNENAPMTDLLTVPGALPAAWSSGCPTIATSGGTFLQGSQWGTWNDVSVTAALKGTQLCVLKFDAAGALVQQWTSLVDRGRLRTATQGPRWEPVRSAGFKFWVNPPIGASVTPTVRTALLRGWLTLVAQPARTPCLAWRSASQSAALRVDRIYPNRNGCFGLECRRGVLH